MAIEITLTDRAAMTSRMLWGRQALTERDVVDPAARFVQPKRSIAAYARPSAAPERDLRIAILSREPDTYSTIRLVEEGTKRGHQIDVIDTARCYMTISAHDGPKVLEVNSSPGFEGIERASGKNLAAGLYAEIERKLQVVVSYAGS